MQVDPHRVRPAAVAGRFYEANGPRLRADVDRFLAGAVADTGPVPKAIIAPHAGYLYSGPIAGSAFAALKPARSVIRRVVLIGPAHYVPFAGMAFPNAAALATPLGDVRVDVESVERVVAQLGSALILDAPHRPEHALEVELPFLQVLLGDLVIVPVLVGDACDDDVRDLLRLLWGGPETCVVVSSDLSHFLPYHEACRKDAETARMILSLQSESLDATRACGWEAIRGLLWVSMEQGLKPRMLDLRNSGDTAGSRDRVVGYGAFALA